MHGEGRKDGWRKRESMNCEQFKVSSVPIKCGQCA